MLGLGRVLLRSRRGIGRGARTCDGRSTRAGHTVIPTKAIAVVLRLPAALFVVSACVLIASCGSSSSTSTVASHSSSGSATSGTSSGSSSSGRSLDRVKADAAEALADYSNLLLAYVNYDSDLYSCDLNHLSDSTGAGFVACSVHVRLNGSGRHLSTMVQRIEAGVAQDPQCQATGTAVDQAVQSQFDAIAAAEHQLETGAKTTSDYLTWSTGPASDIESRLKSSYSSDGQQQQAVQSAFSNWEMCLRQHASS